MAQIIDYYAVTASGQKTVNHVFYEPVSGSLFVSVSGDYAVIELRASDGAYLQANGSTGTLAQGTITVGSPYRPMYSWANSTHLFVVCSNGGTGSFLHKIDRSTRTIVATVNGASWAGPLNFRSAGPGYTAAYAYCGGYLWLGAGNNGALSGLLKVNPTTMSATLVDVTTTTSGAMNRYVTTDGTYLYVVSDANDLAYVRKVDPATDTVVDSRRPWGNTLAVRFPIYVELNGVPYLYVIGGYGNPSSIYYVRLDTWGGTGSKTLTGPALSSTAISMYVAQDAVLVGSESATSPSFCRVRSDLAYEIDAVLAGGAGYGFAFDGVNLWAALGLSNPSVVARFRVESPATSITVAKADATGVQLEFDAGVAVSPAVDIGTQVGSLQVTGVTETSSTLKEIAITVTHPTAPDAPVGNADYNDFLPPVAEADVLGPPAPTGTGAKVV